jgi:hypothetical protein
MIPKYRMPTIQEYMFGTVVGDGFKSDSPTMNVYIPQIMMDKSPNPRGAKVAINSGLFVSKEKITVSSSVTDDSFIKVKVSELFKRHYRELKYAHEATITYEYDKFPSGTKVKVYAPDMNLDNAILVPLL